MKHLVTLTLITVLIAATFGCGANTGAGNVSTTQGSVAIPLVEGFPKDFPMIKGKITASMINNTQTQEGTTAGIGYYTQILADMQPQQAMDFYKPKFSKIIKQTPLKKGSAAMYSGFINKYPVSIYFVEQKDKTMLTIVLSGSKKQ